MYSNYEADYMDAMADRLADINDAIRESNQNDWSSLETNGKSVSFSTPKTLDDEWGGIEEISVEERHACDLYNERNVYPYND